MGRIARSRRGGYISPSRERPNSDRSRFRRRWHSHRSCGDDLGFVIVTHRFHPLNGQRLEVLFVKRRGAESVFVCAGGVVGVQVTMPWSWTDRGEPPRPNRLSIEGLAGLWAATRAIHGCWLSWLVTRPSCVMNAHKNELSDRSTRALLDRRRRLAARLGDVEQGLSGSLTEQDRRRGPPGWRRA